MKRGTILLAFSITAAAFMSCGLSKKALREKEDRDLLKQLAYCKCMEHAIERFVGRDSAELAGGAVELLLEPRGLYSRKIRPVLDSIALTVVLNEVKLKGDTVGKHESSWGRTGYILSCLEFYKSKQLDSLVRSFKKRDYTESFDFIQK